MDFGGEKVLCVPTDAVKQLGGFQGLNTDWEKYVHNLLRKDVASFQPRGDVETDPGFKQIIPYLVIRHRREERTGYVLRYHRAKASGEHRLRGKATIGIGGHINPVDGADNEPALAFEKGWRRELAEEVRIDSRYQVKHFAVLNDDSDPVGQVHFGVVMTVTVDLPCVYPNNHEAIEMWFCPEQEFPYPAGEAFEGWSRLILNSCDFIRRSDK